REDGWSRLMTALQVGIERRNRRSAGEDSRSQHTVATIPELEMVLIESGPFLMGSTDEQVDAWKAVVKQAIESGTYESSIEMAWEELWAIYEVWLEAERGQHSVELTNYLIGKYPVTNAQFELFIQDDGYKSRQLWTESGWAWIRGEGEGHDRPKPRRNLPAYWHHPTLGHANRNAPVVGITWYEAAAYCQWLRMKTNLPYRLPSEAEWEKAARGTDGRVWPWGNQMTQKLLASVISTHRIINPVGYTSEGNSPYGVSEMLGMWQWCSTAWGSNFVLSEYPYPYMRDERENLEGSKYRHLRGGNWSFYVEVLPRCAFRHWDMADNWYYLIGFRVACDAPDSISKHPMGKVPVLSEPTSR
ncbi:MAG: hypothetical protein QOH93_284, partial [Chloroflexia bacterium]|nr:hypothetical protein [Chloroflexia bacterium]